MTKINQLINHCSQKLQAFYQALPAIPFKVNVFSIIFFSQINNNQRDLLNNNKLQALTQKISTLDNNQSIIEEAENFRAKNSLSSYHLNCIYIQRGAWDKISSKDCSIEENIEIAKLFQTSKTRNEGTEEATLDTLITNFTQLALAQTDAIKKDGDTQRAEKLYYSLAEFHKETNPSLSKIILAKMLNAPLSLKYSYLYAELNALLGNDQGKDDYLAKFKNTLFIATENLNLNIQLYKELLSQEPLCPKRKELLKPFFEEARYNELSVEILIDVAEIFDKLDDSENVKKYLKKRIGEKRYPIIAHEFPIIAKLAEKNNCVSDFEETIQKIKTAEFEATSNSPRLILSYIDREQSSTKALELLGKWENTVLKLGNPLSQVCQIAYLYNKMGKNDMASNYLENFMRSNPENESLEAIFQNIETLVAINQREFAVFWLDRAKESVKGEINSCTLQLSDFQQLIKCYIRLDNYDEALNLINNYPTLMVKAAAWKLLKKHAPKVILGLGALITVGLGIAKLPLKRFVFWRSAMRA